MPVTTLGLVGWSFFGVIVRGFQLGIQAKPFNTNVSGYLYSGAFWTAIGYYFNKFVDSNDDILANRLKRLEEARARRNNNSTPITFTE